jgi:hypothetical protein
VHVIEDADGLLIVPGHPDESHGAGRVSRGHATATIDRSTEQLMDLLRSD